MHHDHRYTREIPEPADESQIYNSMVLKLFSHNQNNCGSRGLSLKINLVKRCMAHEDRGRICFACVFACVIDKNPKTPNLSPMADDAIT